VGPAKPMPSHSPGPPKAAKRVQFTSKASEREALICDVDPRGKLCEFGRDPMAQSKSVQADMQEVALSAGSVEQGSPKSGSQSPQSHTVSVLKTGFDIVDLEGAATSKPWAEVWLTFPDRSGTCLGLGGGDGGGVLNNNAEKGSWKGLALRRLKELLAEGSGAGISVGGLKENPERGPDLGEHLQTTAYALERVMHAVEVLQAPEQYVRPTILKDYTTAMVDDVCQDLRVWLERLAGLLPLYHVHMVEAETDRRRLRDLVEQLRAELEREREGRKHEKARANGFEEVLKTTNLKHRTQALLGVADDDDDALVYSRNDVATMKEEWTEELTRDFEQRRLQPLLDELSALRQMKADLQERLRAMSDTHLRPPVASNEELRKALQLLADRCEPLPELQEAVLALEQAAAKDQETANFAKVTAKISQIPDLGAFRDAMTAAMTTTIRLDSEESRPEEGPLLGAVGEQLSALEAVLCSCPAGSGAERLAPLIAWACAALPGGSGEASETPPAWDVDFLQRGGDRGGRPSREFGVNTTEGFFSGGSPTAPNAAGGGQKDSGGDNSAMMKKVREEMEAKYKERMERMKADFAEKLKAEQDKAAAEREQFENLISELRADLKKADGRAKELRTKLMDLQRMMKAKGFGDAFTDALKGSGIGEWIMEGGVFQRLYNDALARMKRWSEAQLDKEQQREDQEQKLRPQHVSVSNINVCGQHFSQPASGPATTQLRALPAKGEARKIASNLLPPVPQRMRVPQDPLSICVGTPREDTSPGGRGHLRKGQPSPRGPRGMCGSVSMPALIGAGRRKLALV